jgi:hypothetical protein
VSAQTAAWPRGPIGVASILNCTPPIREKCELLHTSLADDVSAARGAVAEASTAPRRGNITPGKSGIGGPSKTIVGRMLAIYRRYQGEASLEMRQLSWLDRMTSR